jgi:hypothetical protein
MSQSENHELDRATLKLLASMGLTLTQHSDPPVGPVLRKLLRKVVLQRIREECDGREVPPFVQLSTSLWCEMLKPDEKLLESKQASLC